MKGESSVRKQAKFSRRILYSSRRILSLFAAVFWMSRNAPLKETKRGALRDI